MLTIHSALWCDYLPCLLDAKLALARHDLVRLANVRPGNYLTRMLLLLLVHRMRHHRVSFGALLLLLEGGGVEYGFRSSLVLDRVATLKGANTTVST